MQRRKIILWSVLLLLVLAFVFTMERKTPLSFQLSDGTKLTLSGIDAGKQLRFFHGSIWQKFLYSIVNTNLPYKWRGTETVNFSRFTNGSIGLLFERKAADGFLLNWWNGSAQLVVVNQNNSEQNADRSLVHFSTATISGVTKVIAEEIIWEIPMSTQKELRLRLYETNSFTKEVSTNDFVVKNPADH